jgi:hypothetical protein
MAHNSYYWPFRVSVGDALPPALALISIYNIYNIFIISKMYRCCWTLFTDLVVSLVRKLNNPIYVGFALSTLG